MSFRKTQIDGVRVVSESHPFGRAVAIGFFVDQGSRHEAHHEWGLSHFLEHLAFKGTKKRSAFEIAKSLESLGGDLNAYTTKENTMFHALVLRDHWKIALDVLSDLYMNMDISEKDFEVERSVVLQEMAMSEDQHDEMIFEHYFENCLVGDLAHPILGRPESLSSFSMKQIRQRYKDVYGRNRLIIAASGPLDHDELVAAVEKSLKNSRRSPRRAASKPAKHLKRRLCLERPIEQTHVLVGFEAPSFQDALRFEAFVVNTLIGGGMTSRLYQSVREKKGLAYSIGSHLQTFSDLGLITVQASSEPKHVPRILQEILKQLSELRITDRELEMIKTQVKGGLLLGADDVENRMTSIAVNEMIFNEYRSVDRVIEEIDAVDVASVRKFLKRFMRPETMGICVLGAQADLFEKQVEAWGMN